jgi:hypothetical protein
VGAKSDNGGVQLPGELLSVIARGPRLSE